MCRRRDGTIVLGTGDPGKLYVLEDKFCAKGTATLGRAGRKIGQQVGLAALAGGHAEGDGGDGGGAQRQRGRAGRHLERLVGGADRRPSRPPSPRPAARFIQYRVTLTSEDPTATPALHAVTLRYVTTNQAPEVTKVEVPDLNAVNLENPKKLKFKWSATDANEDDLIYHALRPQGRLVELGANWRTTGRRRNTSGTRRRRHRASIGSRWWPATARTTRRRTP